MANTFRLMRGKIETLRQLVETLRQLVPRCTKEANKGGDYYAHNDRYCGRRDSTIRNHCDRFGGACVACGGQFEVEQ